MGSEICDALLWMVVHAGEDIGGVFLGIDSQNAAVFAEGEHHGCPRTRMETSHKEPIARSQLDGFERVFGEFVVDSRGSLQKAFAQGPGAS